MTRLKSRLLKITAPLHLILILVLLANFAGCGEGDKQTPPNILVLIADDAGWRDFGCYGNDLIQTPHVDALAAAGMKMDRAFLTTPQCSPSRISILTGKYPHQTGAEDLHMPMPASETILPAYLQARGYFTGLLRKAHLGPAGEGQFNYLSTSLDDFGAFLDSTGTRPFFLWVGFNDPHRPYKKDIIDSPQSADRVVVPPFLVDDQATRDDLADYYNEIRRMDQQIGLYIQQLEAQGRLKNTLIVFFSDNGAPFPREKGTLYDAGIRTPLIFSWPQGIEGGQVYNGMVSVIDLAPTLLDIAGGEIPAAMEGNSLVPVLKERGLPGRRYVFSERNWHNCDEHMRSVRTERYKYITNAYIDLPHGTAADLSASPSWKSLKEKKDNGRLSKAQSLLFDCPRPAAELYDVQHDPFELNNLIADSAYREVVRELSDQLTEWEKTTGDFPPSERRRKDNTDRISGVKFDQTRLPARIE